MEIKNLKKAAQRILAAVKNKEKIVLYGDADLDGATSVIILEDTIKSWGGKIAAVYFPDKETEGYGITEKGLKNLKKEAPALLVALDCGIGNFKEVELARSFGFETIIVDHHLILDKLPSADIIVDPKQPGDEYPFKELSAAGLAFKLSEAILGNKLEERLRKNFLELAAMAVIADMMPRESENKIFIEEGLFSIKDSWRPGIRAFLETDYFKDYPDLDRKISKIISILNIRDVKNGLPASFRLLSSSSIEEAKTIIKELLKKAEKRSEIMEKITTEIEKRLENNKDPLIFEGDADFDLILLSSVASALCCQYSKPVFLYKKMARESHGTVRVPKKTNSVSLMKKCSEYLLSYGGHPQASGFRLKNKNLADFKKCLIVQSNPCGK
jgi:single-stranded-DNA-specific exonuclease